MTLLSVVQKQVPSATQTVVDRVLTTLGKTEPQILKDKLGHVVAAHVRNVMASADIVPVDSAMKSAAPAETIPSSPAVSQQPETKPQALNVQAQSAATQSMNFAPTILVAAADRMNAALASEQEAAIERIAQLGIDSARKQMDNLMEWAEVAFANPFMQGILDNTLSEWSGETIESPALMPGQN